MSEDELETFTSIIGASNSESFQMDLMETGELKLAWRNDPDGYFPELVVNTEEVSVSIGMPQGYTPEELGEWIKEQAQEMPEEHRC